MTSEIYRERVLPSAATFTLAPLLAIFMYGVWLPLNEIVGAVSGAAACAALIALLWLKAPVIRLTETELLVGKARIPRDQLGGSQVVTPEECFAERGHLLDSRAFTSFQASVRSMLKVEVLDSDDPTPYWLFSTRQAKKLNSLLG